MESDTALLIGGTAFGAIIILILIIVLAYFLTRPEKKKTPEVKTTPAARTEEKPTGNCPSSPYMYCSSDTIKKIYISSGCSPSSSLIRKLVAEGKITGENDPKVVNCSNNPDLCTAASIRSYPSVICESAPNSVYEGYCS